jgi:antitoxin (DNA-binding transcriptional repressor) of toxin-antitoxin stability system
MYMIVKMPVHRLRAELGDVLRKAEGGHTVVVTRFGKPIAELRRVGTHLRKYGIRVRPARTGTVARVKTFKGPPTMLRDLMRERYPGG